MAGLQQTLPINFGGGGNRNARRDSLATSVVSDKKEMHAKSNALGPIGWPCQASEKSRHPELRHRCGCAGACLPSNEWLNNQNIHNISWSSQTFTLSASLSHSLAPCLSIFPPRGEQIVCCMHARTRRVTGELFERVACAFVLARMRAHPPSGVDVHPRALRAQTSNAPPSPPPSLSWESHANRHICVVVLLCVRVECDFTRFWYDNSPDFAAFYYSVFTTHIPSGFERPEPVEFRVCIQGTRPQSACVSVCALLANASRFDLHSV